MKLRKILKKAFGNIAYRINPGEVAQEREIDIPEINNLGPGDIAIDCGANRGLVTRNLARNGATVHAFEPNPDAFQALSENVRSMPSIHCHNAAVLDEAGQMQLYLHLNYDRNPDRFSEGSSLISDKRNVDTARAVDVEVIDLVDFILKLDKPVSVLKIDIEGAEYRLLNGLIERGAIERVSKVFVETHAHAIPRLLPEDEALRARIASLGLSDKIDMNWI